VATIDDFCIHAQSSFENVIDVEQMDKCATYLANHAPYLNYPLYVAKGYPIATGVFEEADRHLVKDRTEITGARWGLPALS
jgi:hypothetical protein